MLGAPRDPVRAHLRLRPAGRDQRQGWALFAAMFVLWIGAAGLADGLRGRTATRTSQALGDGRRQHGGQGGALRRGRVGLFAASTTGTSTGAVNAAHDSFTPLGGAVPLVNMMLGEVSPGGVGAGLYGMLVFALLAVFIAGLMVGRTPEYLGKKIQATEMKLVVLYLLVVPALILVVSPGSRSCSTGDVVDPQPGPARAHRGRLRVHVGGEQQRLGVRRPDRQHRLVQHDARAVRCSSAGSCLIVPVLALAGSLARKQPVPATAGTFPTGTPLFAGLLVGVVLIVVGLTYFPVLALGPVLEHLRLVSAPDRSPARPADRCARRRSTASASSTRAGWRATRSCSSSRSAASLVDRPLRPGLGDATRRTSSPGSSPPGSGSPCSSRTSPRRWPRAAARRRPTTLRATRAETTVAHRRRSDGSRRGRAELRASRRRRRRRRGRRGDPGRRRRDRGHRVRRRVGDHRRVGARDPRVRRRPLRGHRAAPGALRPDRRPDHRRSRARASSTG